MKPSSNLKYFLNKVVTIITVASQSYIDDKEKFTNYFLGYIEAIDENGLLCKSLTNNCKSYYVLDNIISIAEEMVLDEDNVDDRVIIEEIKKESILNPNLKNQKIDVDFLSNLSP